MSYESYEVMKYEQYSTAVSGLCVIRNLDRSIPDQFPEICEEQKRTWTSCNLYHHLPKIPLKSPDSTQLWKFGSRGMDRDLGSSRCLDISGLKSKKIYSFKGNLEKKLNFFFLMYPTIQSSRHRVSANSTNNQEQIL